VKQITVRGVSVDLSRALEKERRRRGTSLNQVVLDLLRQGLGVGAEHYDNGLSRFAGTWSRTELTAFNTATQVFEQIDEDLWK
jgi:hypothetical protein